MIRFDRGEFEFSDETVKLVDNEDGPETVQPCLPKDSNGLKQVRRQFSVTNGNNAQTCVQTPSTTSTRTSAPSHNREAVETSLEKSTWPGVSIILITYVFESGVL